MTLSLKFAQGFRKRDGKDLWSKKGWCLICVLENEGSPSESSSAVAARVSLSIGTFCCKRPHTSLFTILRAWVGEHCSLQRHRPLLCLQETTATFTERPSSKVAKPPPPCNTFRSALLASTLKCVSGRNMGQANYLQVFGVVAMEMKRIWNSGS